MRFVLVPTRGENALSGHYGYVSGVRLSEYE